MERLGALDDKIEWVLNSDSLKRAINLTSAHSPRWVFTLPYFLLLGESSKPLAARLAWLGSILVKSQVG